MPSRGGKKKTNKGRKNNKRGKRDERPSKPSLTDSSVFMNEPPDQQPSKSAPTVPSVCMNETLDERKPSLIASSVCMSETPDEQPSKPAPTASPVLTNEPQVDRNPTAAIVSPTNSESSQATGKILPENDRRVYSNYKAASKRVFGYFEAMAKEKNNLSSSDEPMTMNVDSLVSTADWMAEAEVPVDSDILEDLKVSIRVRSKVVRPLSSNMESGHKYLLDALLYCWKVLHSLPRAEKENIESELVEDLDFRHSSSREQALQEAGELKDDKDESTLDEEIFSSQDIPRPSLGTDPIPLQDIFDSEDQIDACYFLLILDELMGRVTQHFAAVATLAETMKEKGLPESAIIPALLRATVTTNMAIQQVQRLEIEFQLHNSHISTPYRLFSTAISKPPMLEEVIQATRDFGQIVCSKRDAALFVGDCLECAFRKIDDSERKESEIIFDFCSRFRIDSTGSKFMIWVFSKFISLTDLELGTENESPSHKWLPERVFKYIGGNRSIHHTMRLLQWKYMISKNLHQGNKTQIQPGYYGPAWQPGKTKRNCHDLDELLMNELLEDFISEDGMRFQDDLAPLWVCLGRFARSPAQPVKWSLVFAVHAMLTAMVETAKVATRLSSVRKNSFLSFFRQQIDACEHKKGVDGVINSSHFKMGNDFLPFLNKHSSHPSRSSWNPLCDGTALLYLNYTGNVGYGIPLMDDRSQLKIVLHLYHALIVNNIVQRNDIPFLDGLYRWFKKSTTLWGGSLPEKGNLVEHFWLCMKKRFIICEKVMTFLIGEKDTDKFHLEMIEILCNTEAQVIEESSYPTDEFLESNFRLIRELKSSQYTSHKESTIELMKKEESFFCYNFAACGLYLDEFVFGMSRFFQWHKLFKKGKLRDKKTKREHPERIGEVYMFACHILGKLDQATDPPELGNIIGFVECFMRPFFDKLSSEKQCIWIDGILPLGKDHEMGLESEKEE